MIHGLTPERLPMFWKMVLYSCTYRKHQVYLLGLKTVTERDLSLEENGGEREIGEKLKGREW